jgi:hypothetical protein
MSEGLNLDTNTIILRTILAVTPGTNVPISSGYILASGPGGLMSFTDPLGISSIKILSTLVATIPSTVSTSSGPYNAFFTSQLSTLSSVVARIPSTISTSFATLPNTVTQITAGTNITISPAGGNGNVTINAIVASGGVGVTSTNLTSSIIGLGTVGYISSFNPLYSTVRGLGTAGYISSGQLFSTSIGLTAQIAAGGGGGITTANLTSTIVGLGSAGYISTGQLFSTSIGLTAQIAAGGGGGITTANLTSSVAGLGTAGYISTGQLFSTSIGLTAQIAAGGGGGITTANLVGHVSTANLANLVSTTYLTSQLNSTVIGLGTAGYISTSHLFSTTIGLTAQIAAGGSGITTANLTSTVVGLGTAGYISSVNLTGLVSTANLTGLVSTANLTGLVSTANLTGLVSTANLTGLISTTYLTTQLNSTVIGLGTAGFLSSTRSLQLSTGFISVSSINFNDTVAGYGVDYMTISSGVLLINGAPISGGGGGGAVSQLIGGTNITLSPIAGTGVVTINMPSTFLNTNNLNSNITSSLIGLGTMGYVSTSQLLSTSYGLSAGGIGGTSLTSTVLGLGTAGYISSASLQNIISSANLVGLVSTSYLLNGLKFSSFSNETARLNFSSLYVNNAPILFDQYGNLALSFQTL